MSPLLSGLLGALLGAGAGYQTHRLNQWLTSAEPEANGARLPREELWAPALDAAAVGVLGARFGLTPVSLAGALVFVVLVQVLVFDARHRLILNNVIYPAILLALVLSPINPLLAPGSIQVKVLSATIGAALGGGIFYILVTLSRGGIGMGDAKLAFFLGAAIGLFPLPGSPVIRALVYGILLGAASALVLLVTRVRGLRDYIAYGPYLCLGAIIEVLVFGAPP